MLLASCVSQVILQVILFEDGFETDDTDLVPLWEASTPTYATLNTNPSFSHGGSNSGSFHYAMAVGPPDSADHNVAVAKIITPNVNHFFMRGWVYFKSPAEAQKGKGAQRKLIWVGDETDAGGGGGSWDVILTSFESNAGPPSTIALVFQGQGSACYGSHEVDWMGSVPPLDWDTWYSLEIEVQTNTPVPEPGPYNGIVRVWKNGTLVLNRTDFKVNGNCSTPFRYFSIGRQMNRYQGEAVDEYRYWDDVVISTSYVGP